MEYPSCHSEIADESKFCDRCGVARDLLAPIHGRFIEEFDTPDPKEAKALLDGLPEA